MQNNKTFYNILIGSVVALAIIVGTYTALKYIGNNRNINEAVNTPEQSVNEFYGSWINYEGNPMVDKIYRNNPLITAGLTQQIDSILASFDKSGYDPVLCAQDKPQNFSLGVVTVDGNNASVVLTENFGGSEKNIIVSLKKDTNWQIDNIICEEGEVGEGDLNQSISPAVQNLVSEYIKNNISELSPEEAVLGGKFYVTNIKFQSPTTAIVDYEDGHIVLTARAEFTIPKAGSVEITDFEVMPPAPPVGQSGGNGLCIDKCGDGICDEMVCMGEGCPCAETPESCPKDCR
ncbi:MAG: DUF3828 domain-containing protein [Patescibacteria group bacterium]|nr:DUF3828 domain-containing protein [Patescibacteria group bacterium]